MKSRCRLQIWQFHESERHWSTDRASYKLNGEVQYYKIQTQNPPWCGLRRCHGCRTGTSCFHSRTFPFLHGWECFWRAEPLQRACRLHLWSLQHGYTEASLGSTDRWSLDYVLQLSEIWKTNLVHNWTKPRKSVRDNFVWNVNHLMASYDLLNTIATLLGFKLLFNLTTK